MSTNNLTLKRDPILERLVQPMSEEAKMSLKVALSQEPFNISISIWHGINLFDYEKYEICLTCKIPFSVKEHTFSCIEEAASFTCSSQLSRTDLTGEFRKYLIGQKFHYEEVLFRATQPQKESTKYRIAYKIGESLNLSGGTVLKYYSYAVAIDTLYEESKELAKKILLDVVKVSHENVVELSHLTPDEIRSLSLSVTEDDINHLTFSDIRQEVKRRYTQEKAPVSRQERKEAKCRPEAGIRQMPLYDPDSEVNSLCMTIVSWVSSMERVHRTSDLSVISSRAKLELMKQLTVLGQMVQSMQKSLFERTPK